MGRTPAYANLSDEELAALNARRSPSEQVGKTALCGAKLSKKAVAKRMQKNPENTHTTCQLGAGYGTSHVGIGYCKWHGGNTEAGHKFAARTYGASLIEKERMNIERFGGDRNLVNITPEEALLEEVRRAVAMVRWLEERIGAWNFEHLNSVDPDDPRLDPESDEFDPAYRPAQPSLGGLPRLTDETFKGNATFTDEKEWLDLYRKEREHAIRVSKMAIDAGIAKRMVTLAEDQGRMLALAIRHVLDSLSLTQDQLAIVPQVVPGILRAVTVGQPLPSPVHPTSTSTPTSSSSSPVSA